MTKAGKLRSEGISELRTLLRDHALGWSRFRQFMAAREDPKRIAALTNKMAAAGGSTERMPLAAAYVIAILKAMDLEDKELMPLMLWNGAGLKEIVRYLQSVTETPQDVLNTLACTDGSRWDGKKGFIGEK